MAALADPTRRAVFERLRGGPRPVGEIARDLPVSRPAVSQHLRVLKDAGLVTERRTGGEEHGWGRMLVWEPPRRVAFEWHITGVPTEVEVRFTPAGQGTRVDLEHRGFERVENGAERRDSYSSGWVTVLGRYAAAAA